MTTTDLADFGQLELKELELLLTAFREQGPIEKFYYKNITPMFNMDSGFVFLTNEDYQVLMLNKDNKLVLWHCCPDCGNEGYEEDLLESRDCCKEYIASLS